MNLHVMKIRNQSCSVAHRGNDSHAQRADSVGKTAGAASQFQEILPRRAKGGWHSFRRKNSSLKISIKMGSKKPLSRTKSSVVGEAGITISWVPLADDVAAPPNDGGATLRSGGTAATSVKLPVASSPGFGGENFGHVVPDGKHLASPQRRVTASVLQASVGDTGLEVMDLAARPPGANQKSLPAICGNEAIRELIHAPGSEKASSG